MVNPADLDPRFVNLTGDTMTGDLTIERDGLAGGAAITVNVLSDTRTPALNLRKTRGTKSAQTPVLSGDYLGRINFNTITTTGTAFVGGNIACLANAAPTATGVDTRFSFVTANAAGATVEVVAFASDNIRLRAPITDLLRVTNGLSGIALEVTTSTASGNSVNQGWGVVSKVDLVTKSACCFVATNTGKGTELNTCFQVESTLPAGANNYSIYDGSPAQNYFRGNVGINWTTPTANLEVQGTAKIRGTIEITGNITSAGTAHAFAAASIPASAIGGNFTTLSATGGRSNFAPLSEPFAIGIRHNAAGLPNYIGTTATGDFQVSAAGGAPMLSITGTGNITSTGTAHSFAAKSIPASAINGVPALKADDLTDVTVTTPAAGQVLRWNGTAFVNSVLNYSDLTGTAPGGGLTQAQADARYVELTGDIMSGTLTSGRHTASTTPLAGGPYGDGTPTPAFQADIRNGTATGNPVTETGYPRTCYYADTGPATSGWAFLSTGQGPSKLGGNLTVLGAANSFLRASINGDALADRPITQFNASRTIALSERSTVLANTAQLAADVVITIPNNSAVAFPVGTTFTVADLSAVALTILKADSSVTLNWNASLTGAAAALAGGVGASLTLPGPLFRVTLIKTGTDTWVVLN
jgi:hypothetical protein